VTVISHDGSPGTKRTIAMWNPPVTDPATQARRSPLAEAADLLAGLVIEGARTIVFMKSRKAVELMARFTVLELERRGEPRLAQRIARNREILGLHYPSDSEAGKKIAQESMGMFLNCPTVARLVEAAAAEWVIYTY